MLPSFTSDDAVAQFEFDTQVTWAIRLNPTYHRLSDRKEPVQATRGVAEPPNVLPSTQQRAFCSPAGHHLRYASVPKTEHNRPLIIQLREWSRVDQEIKVERIRLANRGKPSIRWSLPLFLLSVAWRPHISGPYVARLRRSEHCTILVTRFVRPTRFAARSTSEFDFNEMRARRFSSQIEVSRWLKT